MPLRVEPYWLVHGIGPTNHRHATRASAVAEAERLARANPGQTFVVLAPVEAIRLVDVERFRFDEAPNPAPQVSRDSRRRHDVDDDIPF